MNERGFQLSLLFASPLLPQNLSNCLFMQFIIVVDDIFLPAVCYCFDCHQQQNRFPPFFHRTTITITITTPKPGTNATRPLDCNVVAAVVVSLIAIDNTQTLSFRCKMFFLPLGNLHRYDGFLRPKALHHRFYLAYLMSL